MMSPLPAQRDPSTPAALRRGLDALAAIDPTYDVGAGAARLEARLRDTPTAVTAAPGPGAMKLWTVGVLVLGAVVLGASSFGADEPPATPIAVAEPEPRAHPERPPRANDTVVLPRAAAAQDPMPPAASEPAPVSEPPPAVGSSSVRSEPAPSSTRPRKPEPVAILEPEPEPEPDPLLAEMKLLNVARKQITGGRHTEALASIAKAHALDRRRFDEEWEALEILALAGSGKLQRARTLAEPYLAAHQGGRFNAAIERALAER